MNVQISNAHTAVDNTLTLPAIISMPANGVVQPRIFPNNVMIQREEF
jgi:hypothetical protein